MSYEQPPCRSIWAGYAAQAEGVVILERDVLTVIEATTRRLPNGHQFTKQDLDNLAEQMEQRLEVDPFISREHRPDLPPIGRKLKVWVDTLVDSDGTSYPDEYALYSEVELLVELSEEELKRILRGHMSVAFFGAGVFNWQGGAHDKPDLQIGLSPVLYPDEEIAESILFAAEIEGAKVAVRRYHEHALEPGTTLALAVGWWLLDKLGEKLVDYVLDLIFNSISGRVKEPPESIKLSFETASGRVNAYIPVTDKKAQLQQAVASATDRAVQHHKSGLPNQRIGITYDRNYVVRVQEVPPQFLDRKV